MITGNDQTAFGIEAWERPLKEFPGGKLFSLSHLLHNTEERGVLFAFWWKIASRDALFTIPFKGNLFATVGTLDI